MSLINDALKRAAAAQKRSEPSRRARAPKGPEAAGPPMEPVVQRLGRRNDSMFPTQSGMIMLVGMLLLISSFFFYRWWEDRQRFHPQILPDKSALETMIIDAYDKGPKGIEKSGSGMLGRGTEAANNTNAVATATNVALNASNSVIAAVSPPTTNATVAVHPHADVPVSPKPPGTQLVSTPKPKVLLSREVVQGRAPTKTGANTPPPTGTNHTGNPKLTRANNGGANKPEPETTVEFPEIELKGIIIMRDNSSAFVNGKTMRLGDMVRDAELTEIGQQFVKFSFQGVDKKFYLLR